MPFALGILKTISILPVVEEENAMLAADANLKIKGRKSSLKVINISVSFLDILLANISGRNEALT